MVKPAGLPLFMLAVVFVGSARATPSDRVIARPSFRVASGCEAPSIDFKRAHHIDPVRGSSSGDGSTAHPWRRLSDVLSAQMAQIHAGDVIFLATGDYGAVVVSADKGGFVEVTAEPGQHPLLKSLEITGAHWVFSGLKIQSLRSSLPTGRLSALVNIHAGQKAAANIILNRNEISVANDVSTWNQTDWLANGLTGVKVEGGTDASKCVAITSNAISGTGGSASTGGGSAIQIYADQALIADNTIDHFADDAIDFGANDLVISGNRITNNIGVEDGNHNDAMQGFVPGGQRYKGIHAYRNVIIDSNLIVRQTDPALRQPVALQGIDNFGGVSTDWYNIIVTNNVVITNAYHGITFSAMHHGVIAHNTVLADGIATSQRQILAGGKEGRASVPGNQVWIMVGDQTNRLTVSGGLSSDVDVEDNITAILKIATSGARARNNLVLDAVAFYSTGKPNIYKAPGVYGDQNVIDPKALSSFTKWRPATYEIDLAPRRLSKLHGRGSSIHVSINAERK